MDNTDTDVTLTGRVAELERKNKEQERQNQETHERLGKNEATTEQINKSIAAGNRMTNWQFISFVFVMSATLFGTLYWATGVLERRVDQMERIINTKFDDMNRNINERFDNTNMNVNQRFEDTNRRFEDLRQVVLSEKKR